MKLYLDHLGKHLADYIERFNGLVKLYRNERREGLIRARSIGGKKSTGDVSIELRIPVLTECIVVIHILPSDSSIFGCSL